MNRRAAEWIAAGLLLVLCLVGCDAKKSAPPEAKGEDAGQEPVLSGGDYVIQKLESIVIPSVNFEDTTIEDAIEFLRMRMAELDPEEDHRKKGVSFVVRAPSRSGRAGDEGLEAALDAAELLGDDDSPRITLHKKNIRAMDLLTLCAEQVGLNFYLTSRGLLMIPENEKLNEAYENSVGIQIWKVYREAEK